MSVILTSQFNRSETIGTAEKLGILRGKFGKHGSTGAIAPRLSSADFTIRLIA